MITTTMAATAPAPACGPDTDIAVAENASPAAVGTHAPYATHPNTTKKETIPMTDQIPALPEGWRLADHEKYGRIIVTNDTPTTDGHVHFVMPNPSDPLGYDWMFCRPAELTYIDAAARQALKEDAR